MTNLDEEFKKEDLRQLKIENDIRKIGTKKSSEIRVYYFNYNFSDHPTFCNSSSS